MQGGIVVKKIKFIGLFLVLILLGSIISSCSQESASISARDVDFSSPSHIEENLFEIIKISDLSEKEASSVIMALEEFNWKDLNEKGGKKFKKNFSSWIARQNIDKEEEISAIIGVIHNFSKKDYVRVSSKLALVFQDDIELFIRGLYEKRMQINEIAYALYDLSIYKEGSGDLTRDFNTIVTSEKLSQEEKYLGLELIDTIANCET